MSGAEPGLRNVQRWLVGAITETRSPGAEGHIVAGAGPSPDARLEVYRSAYRWRLTECLRDDFPVLARTAGDAEFEALASSYVDAYPSSSPNLNDFGRRFSEHCRDAAPLPVERRAFLAELATLEWAIVEVIHAELAPPLDAAALERLPAQAWASARFTLSSALRIISLDHPTNSYFQACREQASCPAAPSPAPSAVAVVRNEGGLLRMDLTPPMLALLAGLARGETIREVLESVVAAEADPAAVAAVAGSLSVWFRSWASAGFFAGIDVAGSR